MKTNSQSPNYLKIVSHYEDCLEKYGDSHLGVDWPNLTDAETRYQVMLEVIRDPLTSKISILDFGCGASHMYEYIQKKNLEHVDYFGLDISEKFIELSKKKFPSIPYYCLDILQDHAELPTFDFVIMNGVFTEKRELAFNEMYDYFQKMIMRTFEHARVGIAFNVMSTHVDWERDDLFHLPMDKLASFLVKNISRDFVIRNDYQLYEYTAYVYRR